VTDAPRSYRNLASIAFDTAKVLRDPAAAERERETAEKYLRRAEELETAERRLTGNPSLPVRA
jgi:hypothetical protein